MTELGGRSVYWPRGRVIGGSGSVNGLVFLRGSPRDYDRWAQSGARGWSYDDCLPAFRKLETFAGPDSEFRGKDGPVRVGEVPDPSVGCKAFVDACVALGFERNKDNNAAWFEGVAPNQLNVYRGRRWSPAVAFAVHNAACLPAHLLGPAQKRIATHGDAHGKDGPRVLLAKTRQYPADFFKVARVIGPRSEVQFAAATPKMRHGKTKFSRVREAGKVVGVRAGRRTLQAVKQEQQGGARGRSEPVHVDEIAIRGGPAFAPVRQSVCRLCASPQSGPEGLQMPTGQPEWRDVIHWSH